MTVHIREAVPDDLPQVHEMIGLLARHHGEERRISLKGLQAQVLEKGQARILVAAEAEGLVGYAMILTRPDLVTGGQGHDLYHLFVVEWRRRAGIGKSLIAAAREISQREGANVLTIGTHPANLGAQSAYRDMGLEEMPAPGPRFRIELV
jgi:ribosomal protein S18 acetylase RimI-like enzyme